MTTNFQYQPSILASFLATAFTIATPLALSPGDASAALCKLNHAQIYQDGLAEEASQQFWEKLSDDLNSSDCHFVQKVVDQICAIAPLEASNASVIRKGLEIALARRVLLSKRRSPSEIRGPTEQSARVKNLASISSLASLAVDVEDDLSVFIAMMEMEFGDPASIGLLALHGLNSDRYQERIGGLLSRILHSVANETRKFYACRVCACLDKGGIENVDLTAGLRSVMYSQAPLHIRIEAARAFMKIEHKNEPIPLGILQSGLQDVRPNIRRMAIDLAGDSGAFASPLVPILMALERTEKLGLSQRAGLALRKIRQASKGDARQGIW